jgi:hypothetical protein
MEQQQPKQPIQAQPQQTFEVVLAKTFTFQYDGREDRIKMTINYASPEHRMDFFITRSFLLRLFPVIEEIFIKYADSGKVFKSLQQENIEREREKMIEKSIKEEEAAASLSEADETSEPSKEELPTPNHDWESHTDKATLALTETDRPLLIDKVDFKFRNKTMIVLITADGRPRAQANLSMDSFQQILSIMMRIVPFISWGISPNILD